MDLVGEGESPEKMHVVNSSITLGPEVQVPGGQARTRLQVGGIGARIGAYIIDIIIVGVLENLLMRIPPFSFLNIGNLFPNYQAIQTALQNYQATGTGQIPTLQINFVILGLFLLFWFSIYFLYFGLLETYKKGQTIGKVIFSLRSVNEQDGNPVTAKSAFLNSITKGSGFLLVMDLIIGYFSQKNIVLKQIRFVQRKTSEVVVKAQGRISPPPTPVIQLQGVHQLPQITNSFSLFQAGVVVHINTSTGKRVCIFVKKKHNLQT